LAALKESAINKERNLHLLRQDKIIDVSNLPPRGHSNSLLVQTVNCPSFALGMDMKKELIDLESDECATVYFLPHSLVVH
jgi:hypothetical protein